MRPSFWIFEDDELMECIFQVFELLNCCSVFPYGIAKNPRDRNLYRVGGLIGVLSVGSGG